MKPSDPSPRKLAKSLERKQSKHAVLLARVEKAAKRLEKRRLKLHSLEIGIADLERRMSDGSGQPGGSASASLRKALLIFNPTAGPNAKDNVERLTELVECLRVHGIQAQVGLKTSGKAARALARQAVRKRALLVLVAGGDGTIEEVASQLVGSDTVLGIIPIGTMNNLARSLGVPLKIDEACALIGMGTVRHIDVGRVSSNGGPRIECFLEGAGVGLSAIAALAGQSLEKHQWHVVPRALRKLFKVKPLAIKVEMDDLTVETSSSMVTVSNAPLMGSNLVVAPDAKMDDGLLDITLYDGMGNSDLIKHFLSTSKGQGALKTYRARHVRITADEPLPANSDKDIAKERRVVEIEIVPRALAVIAGNGIGLTVPVEGAPAPPPLSGTPPHTNGDAEPANPEHEVASL